MSKNEQKVPKRTKKYLKVPESLKFFQKVPTNYNQNKQVQKLLDY